MDRYILIQSGKLDVFKKRVNESIDKGYVPQGGVAVYFWPDVYYAQAMFLPQHLEPTE